MKSKANGTTPQTDAAVPSEPLADALPICGIVMPIGASGDYSEKHWRDVFEILKEAVQGDFEARLVSSSDEVTIIHKNIVQNLGTDPVVICDVSDRNPNVMFELGLRLCFDLPTVVVKDSATPYSFDTSPIEHLGYPEDLHYQSIVEFKETLRRKVRDSYEAKAKNKDFSPFLKHFGKFVPSQLETTELPASKYLLERIDEIGRSVQKLNSTIQGGGSGLINLGSLRTSSARIRANSIEVPLLGLEAEVKGDLFEAVRLISDKYGVGFLASGDRITIAPDSTLNEVRRVELAAEVIDVYRKIVGTDRAPSGLQSTKATTQPQEG